MTKQLPALVVAQSGGPTAAINASLAGVVTEAQRNSSIGKILGARFGVEGLLNAHFTDLRAQDPSIWAAIRHTPSAALGSCRRKLQPGDHERVLTILMERQVRYLLYIGGNDSADTALGLHRAAQAHGYDLRVIAIPKTIDNDLPGTDHCPGYGSAARFLAQTTQDAGLDTEAMRGTDPLKIIEVMGRDAGWLAAASVLGREDESHAPHLICVPERPLDPDAFITAMEEAYRRYGFAVAVVAETVRDRQGRPLGRQNEVLEADAFGHPTLAGAAQYLTSVVGKALRVKARFDKPGTLQRMCMALASPVDIEEAFAAGATAVRYALEGRNAVMVGFRRRESISYGVEMEPVDLAHVANQVRLMPASMLGDDPFGISPTFQDYALPLLGPPLLSYARVRDL